MELLGGYGNDMAEPLVCVEDCLEVGLVDEDGYGAIDEDAAGFLGEVLHPCDTIL